MTKTKMIIAFPKLGRWCASIAQDGVTVTLTETRAVEQAIGFGEYMPLEHCKLLNVTQIVQCVGHDAAIALATAVNTKDW